MHMPMNTLRAQTTPALKADPETLKLPAAFLLPVSPGGLCVTANVWGTIGNVWIPHVDTPPAEETICVQTASAPEIAQLSCISPTLTTEGRGTLSIS